MREQNFIRDRVPGLMIPAAVRTAPRTKQGAAILTQAVPQGRASFQRSDRLYNQRRSRKVTGMSERRRLILATPVERAPSMTRRQADFLRSVT